MDSSWWGQMPPLEHVYWIIAVASSVVLLIQMVLAFVSGLDVHLHMGNDLAAHSVGDVDLPHFQLLTIRNVVVFFAVFSWVGIAMIHAKASVPLTIVVSFLCGLSMMGVMAAMFLGLWKLQGSGNVDMSGAKGEQAKVYLTIPPARTGTGKINAVVQGKQIEMDAVTDSNQPIPTGTVVKVQDVQNNQAIVERV